MAFHPILCSYTIVMQHFGAWQRSTDIEVYPGPGSRGRGWSGPSNQGNGPAFDQPLVAVNR